MLKNEGNQKLKFFKPSDLAWNASFMMQLWGSLVILQNRQNSLRFLYQISIYTRIKVSNDFKYFFELIFGECHRLLSSETTARPLPDSPFQIY